MDDSEATDEDFVEVKPIVKRRKQMEDDSDSEEDSDETLSDDEADSDEDDGEAVDGNVEEEDLNATINSRRSTRLRGRVSETADELVSSKQGPHSKKPIKYDEKENGKTYFLLCISPGLCFRTIRHSGITQASYSKK